MQLEFNSNAIKCETDKSYLIKIPKKDEAFWYPKKFVNFKGKSGHRMLVWFGDTFKVKIFKHLTKGKLPVGEFSPAGLKDYCSWEQ